MSYEDTHCVCGGRKETETMICPTCVAKVKDTPDYKAYLDKSVNVNYRRGAAIRTLAACRRRK